MKYAIKQAIVIFILSIAILIISFLIIYTNNTDNIIQNNLINTEDITKEISSSLGNQIKEKIKIVKTITTAPALIRSLIKNNEYYQGLSDHLREKEIDSYNTKWKSSKDPDNPFILKYTDNNVSKYFKSQQDLLNNEYGEIFLTNKYGSLIASTAKLTTFAHRQKYWWKGAYNDGKGSIFIDDRGFDDSVGGYVLGIVIPIKKDKEIIGIIKANLNILGSINKNLLKSQKSHEKIQLIRSGGLIVFEEGLEPLSKRISPELLKHLGTEKKSFIHKEQNVKWIVGVSKVLITSGIKGYVFGGSFESIDHKKGNTGEIWYILEYNSVSNILSSSKINLYFYLIIGLILPAIIAVISIIIGKRIAKPIDNLISHTKQISEGNYDSRISEKNNDEFGLLAASFNKMSENLKNTTTSLDILKTEMDQRRKTEEALQKSEERMRTMFEEAPLGIALIDSLDGHIYEVNSQFARIAGRSVKEMSTIDWMSITHPEDVQEDLDNMALLNAEEIDGFNMNKRYFKPDGTIVWINMTIAPLKIKGIRKRRHLCMIEDITKHKNFEIEKTKLEEQLKQAQKMEAIGTLAGGIAHDFNNILGVIIGYTELTVDEVFDDDDLMDNMNRILNASERAKEMIEQILTFSRKSSTEMKSVSLKEIIKETVKLLRATIPSFIKIKTNLTGQNGQVIANKTQINQVIMNICTNAAFAMKEKGGILKLSVEETDITSDHIELELKSGRYQLLQIADTGTGIKTNIINKIFEPYFTTKNVGEGTGMGLAAAYGIIKNHGGTIKVYSELKQGTVFSIYLPLEVAQNKNKRDIINKAIIKGNGERILFVDDEKELVLLATKILTKLGYMVTAEISSKNAFKIFKSEPDKFDLIITDMAMPDITGIMLAKKIHKIRPEIPIIMCTGFNNIEKKKYKNSGINKLVLKPINRINMADAIGEVLKTNGRKNI